MPAIPAMPQFAPGPEAVPEVIDLSSDSSPDPSIEILTVPGGGNSASTDGVQPLDLRVGTSSAAFAVRADEAAKHRYHEEQQLLTHFYRRQGMISFFPHGAPTCKSSTLSSQVFKHIIFTVFHMVAYTAVNRRRCCGGCSDFANAADHFRCCSTSGRVQPSEPVRGRFGSAPIIRRWPTNQRRSRQQLSSSSR